MTALFLSDSEMAAITVDYSNLHIKTWFRETDQCHYYHIYKNAGHLVTDCPSCHHRTYTGNRFAAGTVLHFTVPIIIDKVMVQTAGEF